jgi:hypothetical protein
MEFPSAFPTSTADASATTPTSAAPVAELKLHSSQILAFGAILPHEAAGLRLFELSPTRQLNMMTGRNWSPWQWQQVLRERYEQMTGPA